MLLASAVLLSHSYALSGFPEPAAFSSTLGAFAVQCFFVISGYLICGSASASDSVARYTWKRALRILPALVFAYIFTRYVHGYFDRFSGNPIPWMPNGSIWTLPWEGVCYAITGLAAVLLLLTPATINPVYALSAVMVLIDVSGALGSNTVVPNLFFLFLAGAFIKLNEKSLSLARIALFGAAVIVALQVPPFSGVSRSVLGIIPFALGPDLTFQHVSYFLYLLLLPFPVVYLCAQAPALPFFRGDYSYGAYIYAWPVQQSVVAYCLSYGYKIGPIELFCSSFALTMGFAMVSWHFIERPALSLKNWKIPKIGSRQDKALVPSAVTE